MLVMSGRVPSVTFRPEPPSPSRRAARPREVRPVGARRKDRGPGSGGSPAAAVLRAAGRPHRGGTDVVAGDACVAAAVTSRGPLGGRTGIAGYRPGHGNEAVVQGA